MLRSRGRTRLDPALGPARRWRLFNASVVIPLQARGWSQLSDWLLDSPLGDFSLLAPLAGAYRCS